MESGQRRRGASHETKRSTTTQRQSHTSTNQLREPFVQNRKRAQTIELKTQILIPTIIQEPSTQSRVLTWVACTNRYRNCVERTGYVNRQTPCADIKERRIVQITRTKTTHSCVRRVPRQGKADTAQQTLEDSGPKTTA